jgi:hypothetical protein
VINFPLNWSITIVWVKMIRGDVIDSRLISACEIELLKKVFRGSLRNLNRSDGVYSGERFIWVNERDDQVTDS